MQVESCQCHRSHVPSKPITRGTKAASLVKRSEWMSGGWARAVVMRECGRHNVIVKYHIDNRRLPLRHEQMLSARGARNAKQFQGSELQGGL